MMKKYLSLLAFLASAAATAQVSNVYPRPQVVDTTNSETWTADLNWQVKYPKNFAPVLTGNLPINGKDKFKVTVRIDSKKAPQHKEGYLLKVTKKGATIIGADENGAFYGFQTLMAIASKGKMQTCTITDYPDVAFRGVVEGFYGTPWSNEARMSQLDFYGKHKMNVYIFGPKDDPYHKDKWRIPYPAEQANAIKQLVERAHQNRVRFCWAIHPGVDIDWSIKDRDAMMSKLEAMYQLGVRSFAVFFDDIWGEGAKAEKQAELLNYIDEHFVQAKKDVSPLLLCPTVYNKAWSGDGSYLAGIKKDLNKSVNVMWTGNTVVHDIDKASMNWINERIGRKAYIWWNFAVSDYVRDHLLLGPAYGNASDIAGDLSGFVSNPMEHAEASKLSLFGVADYTWNMKQYDYMTAWNRAAEEIFPENPQALKIFASYNEDPGPNGHGYRREESRALRPIAEKAVNGDAAAIRTLGQKSKELGESAKTLLHSTCNPALIRELRPWLIQTDFVSAYGQKVAEMNSPEEFEEARDLQKKMYDLSNDRSIQHATQTGIKVGTAVLMPALNKIFTNKVTAYNQQHGTDINPLSDYVAYTIESTVDQLKELPLRAQGNRINVQALLEVVTWNKDASFTIISDRPRTLQGLSFDFGQPGIEKDFLLEVFDGKEWKKVGLLQYNAKSNVINTTDEIRGAKAEKIRLTNISGKKLQYYFKNFNFTAE